MPNLFFLVLVAGLLTTTSAWADPRKDPYRAYQEGQYDRALEGLTDLQVENPENPLLDLHLGSTHYQMKNYPEAEKSFSKAALSGAPVIRAKAYYGLGNTAFRAGKLDEAVEWYKRNLEIDPEDEDAKYNLEFVRDEIRRRHEEAQKRQEKQQEQQNQSCDNPNSQPSQEQQQQEQQGQDQKDQDQPKDQEQSEQASQSSQAQEKQSSPQPDEEQPQESQAVQAQKPMTLEEAERALQGLEEDRKKQLEQRRLQMGSPARPEKDW